jgi:hypothetical protein
MEGETMLPFATSDDKLALLPEGAELLIVDTSIPVTFDPESLEAIAWDVHGGRPFPAGEILNGAGSPSTPEAFAALMPLFFVRERETSPAALR